MKAGDNRQDGAKRPKEASREDRKEFPALEECGAARDEFRSSGKRPHRQNAVFEPKREIVSKPVAGDRTQGRCGPERPEIQACGADQAAQSKKNCGSGNEQGNKSKRFTEGEQENDWHRPIPMILHKSDCGLSELAHFRG